MHLALDNSHYSSFDHKVLEKSGRLKVAKRIEKILRNELSAKNLKKLRLLDVGCSSGVISNHLVDSFGEVVGIDIDGAAISLARSNYRRKGLSFFVQNGEKMDFKDRSFDVVVANHVLFCLPQPEQLMLEFARVLKPDGVIYLASTNKYWWLTAGYRVPFLALVPKIFWQKYLKLWGKKVSANLTYLSFWELRQLCSKFSITSYSRKILRRFEPFGPSFIWVLRKGR